MENKESGNERTKKIIFRSLNEKGINYGESDAS